MKWLFCVNLPISNINICDTKILQFVTQDTMLGKIPGVGNVLRLGARGMTTCWGFRTQSRSTRDVLDMDQESGSKDVNIKKHHGLEFREVMDRPLSEPECEVTFCRAQDWRRETISETNGGTLKLSRSTMKAAKYWFIFKDGTNVMMNGSKWTRHDCNLCTGGQGRQLDECAPFVAWQITPDHQTPAWTLSAHKLLLLRRNISD